MVPDALKRSLEPVDARAWTREGGLVLLCSMMASPASEVASETGIRLERIFGCVRAQGHEAGAERLPGAAEVWVTRLGPGEVARLGLWLAFTCVRWVDRVAPQLVGPVERRDAGLTYLALEEARLWA